ncbi:unnamed protein product [Amoebophrya sp. A25]|nr:unnamed protein product [Amoebophrya sp. A25]CAD7947760.1 unnamed protein product [Amoebophrya sp. A25]|eukprot:GSA25T00011588001.1
MARTLTRAERLQDPGAKTNVRTGPGSYDVTTQMGNGPGTGAPFLSMQDRSEGMAPRSTSPGPGAYNAPAALQSDKQVLAG